MKMIVKATKRQLVGILWRRRKSLEVTSKRLKEEEEEFIFLRENFYFSPLEGQSPSFSNFLEFLKIFKFIQIIL